MIINVIFFLASIVMFIYSHIGDTLVEYECCRAPYANTTCEADHLKEDTYSEYTAPRVFLGLLFLSLALVPYTHQINKTHIQCEKDVTVFDCWMYFVLIVYVGAFTTVLIIISLLYETKCYDGEWKPALSMMADITVWTITLLPVGVIFLCAFIIGVPMAIISCKNTLIDIHRFYFPSRVRENPLLTPPPSPV